ncbi:hypothetical protein BV20DRAFT_1058609 [Pilatotrama ljubarskyi]|nr:hypothetical protein BV20DRAFT_1058609 [Pilatotrama ljubarskyi]
MYPYDQTPGASSSKQMLPSSRDRYSGSFDHLNNAEQDYILDQLFQEFVIGAEPETRESHARPDDCELFAVDIDESRTFFRDQPIRSSRLHVLASPLPLSSVPPFLFADTPSFASAPAPIALPTVHPAMTFAVSGPAPASSTQNAHPTPRVLPPVASPTATRKINLSQACPAPMLDEASSSRVSRGST